MLASGLSPLKAHHYHATHHHATLPRERVRACWGERTSKIKLSKSDIELGQISDKLCIDSLTRGKRIQLYGYQLKKSVIFLSRWADAIITGNDAVRCKSKD